MMTYIETAKTNTTADSKLREAMIRTLAAKLVESLPMDKLKRIFEVTVRDPDNRKNLESDFERQRMDMLASRKEVEITVKITV